MPISEMKRKLFKPFVSLALAFMLVLSASSGIFNPGSVVSAATVSSAVRFSKPAICCDVGDTIDLSGCGVQFSASSSVVTSGITWKYNGSTVTMFKPSAKGVYTLTATNGTNTKNVYVVAKNPTDTKYVLYRNDFTSSPADFRVLQQTTGTTINVVDGAYVLDASGSAESYIRVLLPAFLDDFGDVNIESKLKMTAAYDTAKWTALMYRVQNGDFPYMQGAVRYDTTAKDGVEISEKNFIGFWSVYKNTSFTPYFNNDYNLFNVSVKGTSTVFNINGYDAIEFSNTPYSNGAMGFNTRGTKTCVDYIEITLDGNTALTSSCDVSFAKPAIRADIGDTIDLTACDVQFAADSLYTKGSDITWKYGGNVVKTFTPSSAGVSTLTATYGNVTKNIYVVTRNLTDGEYVLYYNDFTLAPTDFRVIQQTDATAYHDGNGNYVIDASSNSEAYGRVLLPSYLDSFGDMKIEARYKDTSPANERTWSSLMMRLQNNDRPYMQMCVRYNTALEDGVEIAERNEWNFWSIKNKAAYTGKSQDNYNTYSIVMQSNNATGYINGTKVISSDKALYVSGAAGLQAKGLKITVDYVKVTLGETTAEEDTTVKCAVSYSNPAIGCNAGQTVLLSECDVQFMYGAPLVDGSDIIWKKDGKVITEFSATTEGVHALTATFGGDTANVYVVAKKTTDSEYVLYYNDFTSAPTDFRVIEASNGGNVYYSNGTYVLQASGSADAYARVLLPAFLDDFGMGNFEAKVKLTSPANATRWGGLMYRVQDGNYPYMQCTVRYNAAAADGVEIAEKTNQNLWSIKQKGTCGNLAKDDYNVLTVNSVLGTTKYYINGTEVLSESSTSYIIGAWGFQANGLAMTVDYVKLSFSQNYSNLGVYTVSGGYVYVRQPETGISIAPSIITEIKTMTDFENILVSRPAVAIMTYDVVNGAHKVVFSDGSVDAVDAINKLSGKVMAAFRINEVADAKSLASFLEGKDQKDVFAVSSNVDVLKTAYSSWKYIKGVYDCSALAGSKVEDMRYSAVSAGSRIVILPESASKEDVTYLNDHFATSWMNVGEGKTASVAAINKGVYGIITPDRAVTEECYKAYYKENTMIRRPGVIGHRGNPSLAQENSIAGTEIAFANGATMVENDIFKAADGVLVVMHDSTIDRTTNGTGNVIDLTSTQLKKYVIDGKTDAPAQPIPTLEDYFKLVKGNPDQRLVIELKHPDTSFAQPLADLIKKYDLMEQIVIITSEVQNIEAIRKLLPGVAVGWLTIFTLVKADPVASTQLVVECAQNLNTVHNPMYIPWNTDGIRDVAYRGITLWPWTLNERSEFDKLMIAGVGGITTDYAQWCTDYVENLTVDANGRVIATTYGGTAKDVSASAELVVVEDALGISYSGGTLNVPNKTGKASYFYRYKATNASGTSYYAVTEVQTVESSATQGLELIEGSSLKLESDILKNVSPDCSVADIMAQFKYPVEILDASGNKLSPSASAPTGAVVQLVSDKTKTAVVLMKGDVNGDGNVDSTDYMRIKSFFLKKISMDGIYYLAADCDDDGTITSTDYMRLKGHFLKKYDLYS